MPGEKGGEVTTQGIRGRVEGNEQSLTDSIYAQRQRRLSLGNCRLWHRGMDGADHGLRVQTVMPSRCKQCFAVTKQAVSRGSQFHRLHGATSQEWSQLDLRVLLLPARWSRSVALCVYIV